MPEVYNNLILIKGEFYELFKYYAEDVYDVHDRYGRDVLYCFSCN